jgi:hypothetical protein
MVKMKTLLSIPLVILILFTGISVEFSTHYCGGSVAATKVSLNGEIATCGMDSGKDNYFDHQILRNHCCDNIASIYSICNIFSSSSFNIEEQGSSFTSLLFSSVSNKCDFDIPDITIFNEIKPPGNYYSNSVDRPVLCIFRI